MSTETFIQIQTDELIMIGNRLYEEIIFCNRFIEKNTRSQIENEWMASVRDSFDFSLTLIRCFKECINDYKRLTDDEIGYLIGKISIQHLIEIINSYERIINKVLLGNSNLRILLEARINEKKDLIEANWTKESNKKSRKLKNNILDTYDRKIHEMAFIRDTLFKHDFIDETDYSILSFAWDIRNSMHTNFLSIRDIDFEYPDVRTGKMYTYKYSKGEELYHPGDLLGFLSISVQIEFIMLKILQKIEME